MRVVITGGARFGKTSIIEELARQGYQTIPEVTRDYINSQIRKTGRDPRENRTKFQEDICEMQVKNYLQHDDPTKLVFFDRGMHDEKAYIKAHNVNMPKYLDFCDNNLYDMVFVTPPWIVPFRAEEDTLLQETYDEAVQMHMNIQIAYGMAGHKLNILPCGSVENRVNAILNEIRKNSSFLR